MKTLDCLKAIAVAGFVILLALNFVFVSAELIKNDKAQEVVHIPHKMWFRTAELKATEEVVCGDFGREILKVIEDDEHIRTTFFSELTEYFTKKYTVKVLSIRIAENKNICIRYILDINKQNPKKTYLVRWAP